MLAGMILALTHGPAAQPFNGLFYATVATIIPVLFLVLAVQGGTYLNLLEATTRASERWAEAAIGVFRGASDVIDDDVDGSPRRPRMMRAFRFMARAIGPFLRQTLLISTAGYGALLLAVLIVVLGTFGEGLAIYALAVQHAGPTAKFLVLVAAYFLLAAVAAYPIIFLARSLRRAVTTSSTRLTEASAAYRREHQSGLRALAARPEQPDTDNASSPSDQPGPPEEPDPS